MSFMECQVQITSATQPRRYRRVAVQTVESIKIPEALLKIGTVVEVTGLSESSIRRRMAAGEFPVPLRDGRSCTRWIAADVTAWLRKQAAANS